MIEKCMVQAVIKEEDSLMYLDFMLSNKGQNIENTTHKGPRSKGVQKQILKMIENLGPYTFECAFIYIQSLIRNSILYAARSYVQYQGNRLQSTGENRRVSVTTYIFN